VSYSPPYYDIPEKIIIFKEYYNLKPLEPGQKVWNIDFNEFSSYNLEVAQELLECPEEIIKCAQLALEGEKDIGTEITSTKSLDILDKVDIHDINFTFPDYCINNKLKVLYIIYVDKTATFQTISDIAKIDKSALSKLFSREDIKNGLVDIGLCQLSVTSTKSHSYKLTEEGINYIKNIITDYNSRQKINNSFKQNSFEIRFYNLPKSCEKDIKNIRSKEIDKFISIKGVVRQASPVRPKVTTAKFECPSCGNTINVLQLDSKFREPSSCNCGRKGRFRLSNKELIDVQMLLIQSLEITDSRINVFLNKSLCDLNVIPGQNVRINGILKEVPIFVKDGGKSTTFDLMIEANSLEVLGEDHLTLLEEDINKIKEFSKKPNVLKELSSKFANSIEDYSLEKQTLILQAVLPEDESYTFKPTRLKINIGIFGIPGTGKSVLGKEASKLYNKSIYVDATTASSVGLTGAVVKDEFLKGYALEAGAVVLAGNGLCTVDELDKIDPDYSQSLASPMESNIVTIHKANIHQSLKATSRVLVLGNFVENISTDIMTPKLLNLKAHLRDRIDLLFRAKLVPPKNLAKRIFNKLSSQPQDDLFVRKYISHASKHKINYDLTQDVQDKLSDFYSIVKNGETDSGLKFSARLLETLRRLCYASAKLRLADGVELLDVDIAISLVKKSLSDIGYQYMSSEVLI